MKKPSLFYTAHEAADLYGCHYHTMLKLIRDGEIPGGEKKGGRYKVNKALFDAWLVKEAAA